MDNPLEADGPDVESETDFVTPDVDGIAEDDSAEPLDAAAPDADTDDAQAQA